ncbi:MAG: hypothetical protein LAN70_16900 [Acidobacteriia bacterium]|nr:hypothetical protein [Terriglobia bacterium]
MHFRRTIAVWMAVMLVSASAVAQERRSVTGRGGPIPEGTPITIRMIDSLSSETAREGDTFHATLDQAILDADGRTLYPRDADVDGRVVRAQPSGRLSDPGELGLILTAISFGGQRYPINTQPWNSKGESHTRSNTQKIGGGAALGAIIGAVAGGGKGAAIGAGVGAAAGTGAAAASGKKEARIESEALLTFVSLSSAGQYVPPPAAPPVASPDPEYRSDAANRPYDQRRDFPRRRQFKPEFTNYDRQNIRGCFYDTANLPPGLARRDSLPPGLERQLERNGTLPPALESRAEPLPDVCNARLPRLPLDWSRVVVGNRVLLLDPRSRIADLFNLDDEE